MADFPRIKWLNIDGQQVPFTEPQHFTGNGDETVRTGHDNPLPVANYTQNDNGIWLPVSKDNPMPTQVTGSIVEVPVFENLEIRDTSWNIKDFDNYFGRFSLIVHSTLNVGLRFNINTRSRIVGSGTTRILGDDSTVVSRFTLRKEDLSDRLYIPSSQLLLKGRISIGLRANDTPDDGELSLSILKEN